MGKRSRERKQWPKRHDAPTRHTVRRWVCADCGAARPVGTLIACEDGK